MEVFGPIPASPPGAPQGTADKPPELVAHEHETNGTHVWMPLFDEVTKKCYVCYCGFHKDLNPDERLPAP